MSEEDLGYDPTIQTAANGERFVQMDQSGSKQRVIIDRVMLRTRWIAVRATTCWKAHPEGHPEIPLVIKDSWQYPERHEEGEILREVTDKGVINVARDYYPETVRVRGMNDNVLQNIRQRLDMATASNYQPRRRPLQSSKVEAQSSKVIAQEQRTGGSSSSNKRPLSPIGPSLSPSKRICSDISEKPGTVPLNRVHRRVIVKDSAKAIYKASYRQALLAALEGCIKGHESLLITIIDSPIGGIDDLPGDIDEATGIEPVREESASLAGDEMALIAQKILLLRQMCMTCFQRTEKEYMDNPPVGIELPTFQCEFAESSIGTEDAPRTTRRKKADVDSMTARCAHCNANNRTCAPVSKLDPFSRGYR
ncbi:hypothetical protein UVI_02043610 [Ustilaginoidea virens]|uniref:Fungal-type protein kinase domain-containing protein n=1 Tax=Ustilaginoidea virens TaxID=1159556 RepID=A0A1B5LAB8_USTVR|nr:hypothetical protein UVI_02043610 [Ustilaginoidea virens]